MAAYHIRTPEYLEEIITLLAEQCWKTLRIWNILESNITKKDYVVFRSAIGEAMAERLRMHRLSFQGSRNSEYHVLDSIPYDRIYHSFPITNLDIFLAEVSSKSISAITKVLKPNREEEACRMLSCVLKLILGEYVYVDPVCGKTELCFYSSSVPTKIWNKTESQPKPLEQEA